MDFAKMDTSIADSIRKMLIDKPPKWLLARSEIHDSDNTTASCAAGVIVNSYQMVSKVEDVCLYRWKGRLSETGSK